MSLESLEGRKTASLKMKQVRGCGVKKKKKKEKGGGRGLPDLCGLLLISAAIQLSDTATASIFITRPNLQNQSVSGQVALRREQDLILDSLKQEELLTVRTLCFLVFLHCAYICKSRVNVS